MKTSHEKVTRELINGMRDHLNQITLLRSENAGPEEYPHILVEPQDGAGGTKEESTGFRRMVEDIDQRPTVILKVLTRSIASLYYRDEDGGETALAQLSDEEQEILNRYCDLSGVSENMADGVDDGLQSRIRNRKVEMSVSMIEDCEASAAESMRDMSENLLRFRVLIAQAAFLASWLRSEVSVAGLLEEDPRQKATTGRIAEAFAKAEELLEEVKELHGIEESEDMEANEEEW